MVADEGPDKRRFAGTVVSKQTDDLVSAHMKVDVIQGHDVVELHRHVIGFYEIWRRADSDRTGKTSHG